MPSRSKCFNGNKVKAALPNYTTKKELNDGRGADASNLAAKRDIITFKAEFDKLENYASFVNTMERSFFYQLPALKKIFFCSQKRVTSTFPLS